MPPKTQVKKRYQKMDPVEHILARPDMYVGSTRSRKNEEYIAEPVDNTFRIFRSEIAFSPAILRIFVEPLSNAIDNVERSKKTKTPCTKIAVNIDSETGQTSVWNDGDVVPIEIDEEEQCYNHSMIFGQLLTGSNYDDDEERIVSGRNGLGVKLCNVFSKSFKVRGFDPKTKKILTQEWKNNMRDTDGPEVHDSKLAKGFTEVIWTPDFKQFNMKGYTQDIINLYTRYVVDAAMLSKVPVYFNNSPVPVTSLLPYSRLYDTPTDESLAIRTKTCDVVVTPSSEFQAISFVNGVYTRLGGKHVDAWSEAIFRPLVNKFNKKGKPQVNIRDVKQFFRLFVVATVDKPEYDGQDKNKLESPDVPVSIQTKHINAIAKWTVCDQIQDIIRGKEIVVMKKSERKRKGFTKIEGLDPANNAGTKFSKECTLIICEGLSAKTYAVAGIDKGVYGKSGRDWFGIYPVRGKLLNVRNATPTSIAKNREVTDLIQAIGLRHGEDYTDDKVFSTLRYGKVMFMTDADVDGIHIEGLGLNLFHTLFPSLLERDEPYIVSMKTPIVRVFRPKVKGGDLLFYDENKFREFQSKQTKKFESKYYKGLGSSKSEDVPDTFGTKMVEFINDEDTPLNMNKVFHKKYADMRKDWLSKYDHSKEISLDDVGETYQMGITDFVDGEMIKFSINDCKRSIPSGVDGFKESHRKILYAVKKRKLKYSGKTLKVAQLGGYVAEHTNYHHGEQNLYDTITKMANEFPGSNNIPLLYRDGQFGTRGTGGKDSASARYIFTKMDMLTHLIFRDEDDVLLERVVDDGDIVEPKFYMPIIPMILVNGCTAGIGTGWSCTIPCYNPIDLIESIKVWLDNDGETMLEDEDGTIVSLMPELTPWYRGFEGEISPSTNGRFITYGICSTIKRDTVEVTELPVGMWTDNFKEKMEDHLETKAIKTMKNYSTPKKAHFILTEAPEGIELNIDSLKLHTYLSTSNMVLFNEKEQLRKYNTVDDLINDFCKLRYEYYIRRKEHQVKDLEQEARLLGNKERFIREVIDKTLNIMKVKEEIVIKTLEERGYDKDPKKVTEDGEEIGGYDYLLRMQIRTFTVEKVQKLKNDIESKLKELDALKKKSEKDLWLADLYEFENEYKKYLKVIENEKIKIAKKGKK